MNSSKRCHTQMVKDIQKSNMAMSRDDEHIMRQHSFQHVNLMLSDAIAEMCIINPRHRRRSSEFSFVLDTKMPPMFTSM